LAHAQGGAEFDVAAIAAPVSREPARLSPRCRFPTSWRAAWW